MNAWPAYRSGLRGSSSRASRTPISVHVATGLCPFVRRFQKHRNSSLILGRRIRSRADHSFIGVKSDHVVLGEQRRERRSIEIFPDTAFHFSLRKRLHEFATILDSLWFAKFL